MAVVVGLANAAVTVYWLCGGERLLDTVGGAIERWGRERGVTVLVVLAAVAVVKAAVAVVPLFRGSGRLAQAARVSGWVSAAVLVGYGGLLTLVGLLVQGGVIASAADADTTALAWHAFVWDPWFLLWGLALGIHLVGERRDRRPGVPDPDGPVA